MTSAANATIAPPRDKTLVVVGTVFSITQGASELKPWVVTIEVEKVLRGEYRGSWFSFTVHSPERSGLKQGRSYRVEAVWKGDADGSYQVNEHQWMGREPRSIAFSIAAPSGTFEFNKPVVLHCRFTNQTSSAQTILLPSRSSGAPAFLRARVWDSGGTLLTKNDVSPDGWWSVHALDSTLYQGAAGDRIEVGAGREVVVDVDLAMILGGCRSLGGRPLRPGRYRVQLDSEVGPSNELMIEVGRDASSRARH